ncbi:thiolase family protein [Peribacillus kribbensis]|uniref:thiolase family protein n=1 Tax=Peribacillus kribbensis TaxID=356658 RepID=UPI00040E0D86|nr:thiolase family protein [Peribacillus kribbensis]
MREAVIIEGVRTPVGKKNGDLKNIRADELLAMTIKELVKRTEIEASQIEDVIVGCVSQIGEQAGDIARVAALIAGLPIEVPGTTIDRQCGSSQQAVHFAAQAIISGDMDVVIAGGVESMSRIPIGSNYKGVKPSSLYREKYDVVHQGISAERIADKYTFSREELDIYSLHSHEKALHAWENGYFNRETFAVEAETEEGQPVLIKEDSGPRKDSSLEGLANLKPVFTEDGVITAGNSSQISDGAACLLIMSAERAKQLGLKPKCKIHTRVVVGSDPELMLTGPIAATQKALEKSGLTLRDIDIYEVNEAFASVPLAWLEELDADPRRLNPNGGAIALGHPLGASGARIMVSLVHELERTKSRYGLQTMCEGHGMANATILERLD